MYDIQSICNLREHLTLVAPSSEVIFQCCLLFAGPRHNQTDQIQVLVRVLVWCLPLDPCKQKALA